MRFTDGSSGDADYSKIGGGYSRYRQPEPLIFAAINEALGDARTVLNVGAGAGSYEPRNREVVAIEPSESMRLQRPSCLVRAIDGVAEKLPFEDRYFDASMASITVHQWQDLRAGLTEMRRVTRGPVLILTCDPAHVHQFWLNHYAPEVLSTEARRYPDLNRIAEFLAGGVAIKTVPIPLLCKDGFGEAYYGRPEKLLEDGARRANSAWSFVDQTTTNAYLKHLSSEIEDGQWDARYGHLRNQPFYEGSLRLMVSKPA
jgi:SAM-dependent methyltransferase